MIYKPLTASRLPDQAQRRMQLSTDLLGAKLVTRNDAMLARWISGSHIFGLAIVSLCLAIAILAQKKYVQNTEITVAKTNVKAFDLWFCELKTRSKNYSKKKKKIVNYLWFCSPAMLCHRVRFEINLGDLANLRNPFVEGGDGPLFALVAAKAPYGIANGMGCSAENFEFGSVVINNSNLLSF